MPETEVVEEESCGGNCDSCAVSSCDASEQRPGEDSEAYANRQLLTKRMLGIKHKIVVLSGKGGVGKSTIAVNLAISLSLRGKKVGLLDVDIHGPSIPTMLHMEGIRAESDEESILPLKMGGLKVMSVGFLLENKVTFEYRGESSNFLTRYAPTPPVPPKTIADILLLDAFCVFPDLSIIFFFNHVSRFQTKNYTRCLY